MNPKPSGFHGSSPTYLSTMIEKQVANAIVKTIAYHSYGAVNCTKTA